MTSYLPLFQSLADDGTWALDGDNMLVEVFDEGEDAKEITRADGTKANLILSGATNGRQVGGFDDMKPLFVRVLKVGRGYIKEDGTIEPLDLKPGAIVEVPRMAPTWRSKVLGLITSGETKLGFVQRSAVMQSFPSEDAYRAVVAALKAGGGR